MTRRMMKKKLVKEDDDEVKERIKENKNMRKIIVTIGKGNEKNDRDKL